MTPDPLSAQHSTILSLGGIIQRFTVRLSEGARVNLVLNFPTPDLYQRYNVPYFGETIGRLSNRIANARINLLNGRSYNLSPNDGDGRGNCLHGGTIGWGKKPWTGPTAEMRQGRKASRFDLLSPDNDEGFPGQVRASVWYYQSVEEGEGGEEISVLEMEYEAQLVGSSAIEETVVGMTNHRLASRTLGLRQS
jgi:aldose 1-epimerase